MKIFQSTRLTLTAWYLLIIMCITLLFSMVLYRALTYELDRFQQRQQYQLENPASSYLLPPREYQMRRELAQWSIQAVVDAKSRIFWLLAGINAGIFLVAGGIGYMLAGRTLRPIKEMVDEQHRFITDASHELRTPLTALKSEIEVGLRDKQMTLKDARELLNSNLEEVNNLTILSNSLLELAQYPVKATVNVGSLSIDTLIVDARKRVLGLAKKRKITVSKEEILGNIKGNKEQLTEVFVILLDNAIKYSPEKTTVSITGKKIGNQIRVSFTDQGIGIPIKDLAHIFDRFYRSENSRSKVSATGYGLGLSIAKKIIEQHQGKIHVKSLVGKGTTFTVSFPLI